MTAISPSQRLGRLLVSADVRAALHHDVATRTVVRDSLRAIRRFMEHRSPRRAEVWTVSLVVAVTQLRSSFRADVERAWGEIDALGKLGGGASERQTWIAFQKSLRLAAESHPKAAEELTRILAESLG